MEILTAAKETGINLNRISFTTQMKSGRTWEHKGYRTKDGRFLVISQGRVKMMSDWINGWHLYDCQTKRRILYLESVKEARFQILFALEHPSRQFKHRVMRDDNWYEFIPSDSIMVAAYEATYKTKGESDVRA